MELDVEAAPTRRAMARLRSTSVHRRATSAGMTPKVGWNTIHPGGGVNGCGDPCASNPSTGMMAWGGGVGGDAEEPQPSSCPLCSADDGARVATPSQVPKPPLRSLRWLAEPARLPELILGGREDASHHRRRRPEVAFHCLQLFCCFVLFCVVLPACLHARRAAQFTHGGMEVGAQLPHGNTSRPQPAHILFEPPHTRQRGVQRHRWHG